MDFIKKHAVLIYFVVVFVISWGGNLAVIGPGGYPGTAQQIEALTPLMVLTLLGGPSVAGILMTGLVYGSAGLRAFLARLLRWRVGAGWYGVALLTAPLLMTGILLTLSLFSPAFLPAIITADDKVALLMFGIPVALSAGIFEELGWTGFAIPELRRRYNVLTTGLIVGVLWAIWHLLPGYWLSGLVSGPLALTSYMLDPFLFLVLFRVLMVWVYDHTDSLLVAMLMHVSLTGSARMLGAAGIAGIPLMTFDGLWAVALVLVLAAVAVANGGHLTRDRQATRRDRHAPTYAPLTHR
jgi:membrane protease YdiL (CAAX protease family)